MTQLSLFEVARTIRCSECGAVVALGPPVQYGTATNFTIVCRCGFVGELSCRP